MHWKQWPYWLRGGVIGGGVTFVDLLLLSSCNIITSNASIFGCSLADVIFGLWWPIALLFKYLDLNIPSEAVLSIITILAWFIVGSFFGFLFGLAEKKRALRREL